MSLGRGPETAGIGGRFDRTTQISLAPQEELLFYIRNAYIKKHKEVRMDISFKGSRLRKLANSMELRNRKLGPEMARVLGRRLDQLRAAETLDDMPKEGRGRCHELKGNRAGTLSVDLVHPQRLIFEPANEPVSYKDDGGLDWSRVTAVRILEVADTHE